MSVWVNNNGTAVRKDSSAGGASALTGLEDVNLQNVQNNQVLKYNSSTNKWENGVSSVIPEGVLLADGTVPASNLTIGSRASGSTVGTNSFAQGSGNTASGAYSTVEGFTSTASASAAHAEGYSTASGNYAHSEGYQTSATGGSSHAEGGNTTASGNYSHAEGNSTTASGIDSHAEGVGTTAAGQYSHAEGYYSRTNSSNGTYSHAEGYYTNANAPSSHAEGHYTNTSGYYSHAEGYNTSTSANCAHAEGYYTQANATQTHAEGDHTIAGYAYQHVQGKYNNNKSDTLFEIGNGQEAQTPGGTDTRSNAFEVTSDGYIRTHNNSTKIAFGVDSNGNYGYIKPGADTVYPFRSSPTGTANTSDVLSGKTFSSQYGDNLSGSIVTRSASSETISSAKSYSAGYYPSSWTVTPNPYLSFYNMSTSGNRSDANQASSIGASVTAQISGYLETGIIIIDIHHFLVSSTGSIYSSLKTIAPSISISNTVLYSNTIQGHTLYIVNIPGPVSSGGYTISATLSDYGSSNYGVVFLYATKVMN